MRDNTARILAVSVGAVRLMDVRGKQVETSIDKRPVSGPVAVGVHGLDGDGRVERRKMGDEHHAVYVYPYEHYAFWQRELGREAFAYGQFGENLTTEGLDERRVRVGDIFRAGTTLLQVAHPRIPCRKLDARMGLRFARRFLASRRVGFYLRVLETGHLRAGDAFCLVDSDGVSPTIDTFVRVATFDHWDVDGLEALLAARDLVPAWDDALRASLARARAADGWVGLRGLVVTHIAPDPPDAFRVTLRCARDKPLPAFVWGQALTARFGDSPSGPRRRFPLTHADTDSYEVAVHPTAFGDVDPKQFLQVGAEVRCAAPHGTCVLPGLIEECRRLIIVSQGHRGAFVAEALLRAWSVSERRPPTCHVQCSGASERSRAARRALAASYPELERIDMEADPQIPAERAAAYPLDPLPPHLRPDPDDAVFVIGPTSFLDAVRYVFYAAGLDSTRLRFERIMAHG